jgi:aspartyl-tRNA(Asn)/glutamyl-tRNA(Gln) amidotransferase subunit A
MLDPFCSVADAARAFRAGTASPLAETRAALDRIAAAEPRLNAFTLIAADRALAAATRAGAELAAGMDRGPFHGVPVSVKDLVDMGGLVTGYGTSAPLRSPPQPRNAALVDRLEAAGAVILGKNNCLEFAYGAVNPAVGQTNNPHDPQRTAGGSSGGGAAAVAAGLVWGAVGTDTGGSIRIPAAYCGITGFKPSFGAVPLDGVFPLSPTLDHAGPMTRSAADALALFDVLSGQSGEATPALPHRLRLGVIREQARAPVIRPDVAAVFEAALAALSAAGVQIEQIALPALDGFAERLVEILLPEAARIHAGRMATHADAYGPQTLAQLRAGPGVSAMTYLAARNYAHDLGRAYAAALTGFDALIAPSVAWVAPKEDPAIDGDDGYAEMLCSALGNLTGAPSVSIHAGAGEAGMPVGLTLNGPVGGDRRLLHVAACVEGLMPPRPRPAGFGGA